MHSPDSRLHFFFWVPLLNEVWSCPLPFAPASPQEDRHVVISCLHSPEDHVTKFDACPPVFFAVYDGHNGDLASDMAKTKVKLGPTPQRRQPSYQLLEAQGLSA